MRIATHFSAALILGCAILTLADAPVADAGGAHAHNVYFELHDDSEAARERLIAACKKYLSGYEGMLYFAAGVVAEDMTRDVNVTDFDVSLHVTFADRSAHDRYQTHPRHKRFVEENQANWKSVRVFDSTLR